MNEMKSPDRRALIPAEGIIVRFGFLAWMLGITFLYGLLSIPERMLVGSRLVILRWAREFLLQFFYRDYIF